MDIFEAVQSNDFIIKALSQQVNNDFLILNFDHDIFINECMYLYYFEIKYCGIPLYPSIWTQCTEPQDINSIVKAIPDIVKEYEDAMSSPTEKDFVVFVYYALQIKYNSLVNANRIVGSWNFIIDTLNEYITSIAFKNGLALSRKEIYLDCLDNFIDYFDLKRSTQ